MTRRRQYGSWLKAKKPVMPKSTKRRLEEENSDNDEQVIC